MSTFISHSQQETIALGVELGKGLHGGEVIAFTGGLGAGKTTFSTGIAQQLGCIDPVSSPTFAIVNFYRGPIPFAHFDAYRINTLYDLETAGFYDYLEQGAVIAVEWSENIQPWLGDNVIYVHFKNIANHQREISIEGASWL